MNDAELEYSREVSRAKLMNEIQRPTVMSAIQSIVKDWGEAFVVFIGETATYVSGDAGAARHEAREAAEVNGRNRVRLVRIPKV